MEKTVLRKTVASDSDKDQQHIEQLKTDQREYEAALELKIR
jgi:hypothetical protein